MVTKHLSLGLLDINIKGVAAAWKKAGLDLDLALPSLNDLLLFLFLFKEEDISFSFHVNAKTT